MVNKLVLEKNDSIILYGFTEIKDVIEVFFCGDIGIIVDDRMRIPGGVFVRGWRHNIGRNRVCENASELVEECERLGGVIQCFYDNDSGCYVFARRELREGEEPRVVVPL